MSQGKHCVCNPDGCLAVTRSAGSCIRKCWPQPRPTCYAHTIFPQPRDDSAASLGTTQSPRFPQNGLLLGMPGSGGSKGVCRNPRLAASGGWSGLTLNCRCHGTGLLAAATARCPQDESSPQLASASHLEPVHYGPLDRCHRRRMSRKSGPVSGPAARRVPASTPSSPAHNQKQSHVRASQRPALNSSHVLV